MTESIAAKVAHDLLAIGAVALKPNDPFTWASGLKSPIYTDNRMTISYPSVRRNIYTGICAIIREHFPEVEVIAGTATAGIPHAAWVAQMLDLPMIYVRSKPKDHGQGNQIEGDLKAGQKVVMIDDLISTGGSVLKAVDAVKAADADVMGVCAVFTYQLDAATKNFGAYGLDYYAVTNYSTLIETAETENLITSSDIDSLKKWREDPASW